MDILHSSSTESLKCKICNKATSTKIIFCLNKFEIAIHVCEKHYYYIKDCYTDYVRKTINQMNVVLDINKNIKFYNATKGGVKNKNKQNTEI